MTMTNERFPTWQETERSCGKTINSGEKGANWIGQDSISLSLALQHLASGGGMGRGVLDGCWCYRKNVPSQRETTADLQTRSRKSTGLKHLAVKLWLTPKWEPIPHASCSLRVYILGVYIPETLSSLNHFQVPTPAYTPNHLRRWETEIKSGLLGR